jgi:hypothetical protein
MNKDSSSGLILICVSIEFYKTHETDIQNFVVLTLWSRIYSVVFNYTALKLA